MLIIIINIQFFITGCCKQLKVSLFEKSTKCKTIVPLLQVKIIAENYNFIHNISKKFSFEKIRVT